MNCNEKTTCICCDNKNLIEILDLKNQPLANTYHLNDEKLPEFPLKLNLLIIILFIIAILYFNEILLL